MILTEINYRDKNWFWKSKTKQYKKIVIIDFGIPKSISTSPAVHPNIGLLVPKRNYWQKKKKRNLLTKDKSSQKNLENHKKKVTKRKLKNRSRDFPGLFLLFLVVNCFL